MNSTAWTALALLGVLAPAGAAPPRRPGAKPRAKPPAAGPVRAPMAFSPAELELAPGESYPVELFVPSPTGRAARARLTFTVGGPTGEGAPPLPTVAPDPRWNGRIPPWGRKVYPKVTAPPDLRPERAEGIKVGAALDGGASASLAVRILEPRLEVTAERSRLLIRVTSPFSRRTLKGRVELSNPDRFLEDVRAREYTVGPGRTAELIIPLPGAAPVEGTSYDFGVKLQTYTGYRTEQTLALVFPEQPEMPPFVRPAEKAPEAKPPAPEAKPPAPKSP